MDFKTAYIQSVLFLVVMNWIQGIQRAIDYVEENITEEIDLEEAAKQAYSSSFHFQRVFGILCGFSLGEYIRMRRLSLAGEGLSKGNAKIIDIAMKYGYDTPESFSRAFTRFHGIAPSEAKHGGKVRIFTPLSVKLTLTGGSKMDYRIEKRDAFQIVCKRKRVDKPQSANATPDITAMWREYGADGTMGRLIGYLPKNPVMKGLLGICFSSELNAKQFPYGIGVEYDGRTAVDAAFSEVEKQALSGISEEELDSFLMVSRKLCRNLQENNRLSALQEDFAEGLCSKVDSIADIHFKK